MERVVAQLEEKPRYLFMYLDCLFEKDPHLVAQYGDKHVSFACEKARALRLTSKPSIPDRSLRPIRLPSTR